VVVDWDCCWTSHEIPLGKCPNIFEGEEALYGAFRRRVLEKCLECPSFRADVGRLQQEGGPFAEVVPLLVAEVLNQKAQLTSLASFLNTKSREIRFLHELGTVLQTSMELDEVLSVALTAITAGQGFGMNRAFLLLVDRDAGMLRGHLGIGPRDYDEAWRIWSEIDQRGANLESMAHDLQRSKLASEKVKFQDMLQALSVRLDDNEHIFNRALQERKPFLIENAYDNQLVDRHVAEVLGVDSFLVVPIISVYRRIGILLADNFVTRKPVTPHDLQSIETFAFPVAFAIERASLYERVQEQVDKLTLANAKLKEQQELILRMEKMALIGRITSSIAHSIRNPLMIIGGFARSLLKSSVQDDPKREYLDTIVREAKQLENALEEVLNYSDSLYPVVDQWDINQLVQNVCSELKLVLEQRQVSLSLELGAHLPEINIDYKKIAYCVRTVMGNSLENVRGVTAISILTRADDDAVYIEVSDNGDPYTPIEQDSIVTPFAATQELGSGLGLPLCKTILERYGNHFLIETPPEGGTKYTIRLLQTREDD
jgi:signal transduction histidine kinase